jgi:hypothetical protein
MRKKGKAAAVGQNPAEAGELRRRRCGELGFLNFASPNGAPGACSREGSKGEARCPWRHREKGKSRGARSPGGVSAWGQGGMMARRLCGIMVRTRGKAPGRHGAPASTPDAGWRHGREKGERPWRRAVRWGRGEGRSLKGHGGSMVGVWGGVAWRGEQERRHGRGGGGEDDAQCGRLRMRASRARERETDWWAKRGCGASWQ